MNLVRIIKKTYPDKKVQYFIQKKYFWGWSNVTDKHSYAEGYACYDTLEEAKKNLCYYDGTKTLTEIVK